MRVLGLRWQVAGRRLQAADAVPPPVPRRKSERGSRRGPAGGAGPSRLVQLPRAEGVRGAWPRASICLCRHVPPLLQVLTGTPAVGFRALGWSHLKAPNFITFAKSSFS